MLASLQGGKHLNRAGHPRKRSWWSLSGAVTGQAQPEPRGERPVSARASWACGSARGLLAAASLLQPPLRKALKYVEGPAHLEGPALALSVRRAQRRKESAEAELDVLGCSPLAAAGAAWAEPGRWCVCPISSPRPSGRHPFLRCFCTHHRKVYGVSV